MTHSGMAIKQILLIGMVFGGWACTIASPAGIVRKASGFTIREVTIYPTLCTHSPEFRVKSTRPMITVSYREPTTNKDGTLLNDLKWTTIYFGLKKDSVKAIDVWTNNARGGASVEIQDIPIPVKQDEEVLEVLCVTATDRSGNESITSWERESLM